MKKIKLSIADNLFNDVKQHMYASHLASTSADTDLSSMFLWKIIQVITEGKTEYTMKYKKDK